MTKKKFDLLVFVGRFSPFHAQHKRVVDIALSKAENVLLLIGSAGNARTIRNPFSYEERKRMIEDVYFDEDFGSTGALKYPRLHIRPVYDRTYNDTAWIAQVQDIVKEAILKIANPSGFNAVGIADLKIGLIGASKDHTSYYLKLFPNWDSVDVPITQEMNATDIRNMIFDENYNETCLPDAVHDFIFGIDANDGFVHTPEFQRLKDERVFVQNYKKQWEVRKPLDVAALTEAVKVGNQELVKQLVDDAAGPPYPSKMVTVDSVVEQSGHVLLVRRGAAPGKGLWALPGGHLEMDETLLNGALRELREETKLKVPLPVLKGSIVNHRTFDEPNRSTIGRVITTAFHFKLQDDVTLPKVKGSDDADKAQWVPISDLKENYLMDDHYHILNYFLRI